MPLTTNQVAGISDANAPLGYETEVLQRAQYHIFRAPVTDGGTAATDALVSGLAKLDATAFPNGGKVVAAYLIPSVAVTGHDTNNKVMTFSHVTSAGASATTIGTVTTNTTLGNLAANQAGAATLTAANCIVPSGGSVLFTMTHGGSGVAIAGATGSAFVEVVVQKL